MVAEFEAGQTAQAKLMINEIELTMNLIPVGDTALDPGLAVSPINGKITSLNIARAELQSLFILGSMTSSSANK